MDFKSVVGGADKFIIMSVGFSFSINERDLFCMAVALLSFVEYCFLSNVNMELV